MARPRKGRLQLPPHVHCTTARGKQYFTYHPFRGTKRSGKRIKLPGAPLNPDGTPNPEWWAAYRLAAGEPAIRRTRRHLFRSHPGLQGQPGVAPAQPPDAEGMDPTSSARPRQMGLRSWLTASSRSTSSPCAIPARALPPMPTTCCAPSPPSSAGARCAAGARDNPCLRIPKFKIGEGWAPWPWDAIQHFRQHARPDLWEAAALALYTGQRMSDVLVMQWSDIDQGLIAVVQGKTRKKLWIPIHKELGALLALLEIRARKAFEGKVIDLRRHHQAILTNTRGAALDPQRLQGLMVR